MAETNGEQTFHFQAEVKQLLHLVVHSLYSNREIFLRELISNASDANDKLRFAALTSPDLLTADADLGIRIEVDPQARTISVADNGIGMDREQIVEQLGTIAHSGTGAFLRKLTGDQKKDAQLIGQFGVGFYSAFTVAREVEVLSRKAAGGDDEAIRWVSSGEGEFKVTAAVKPQRGTTVTLHIKDDAAEFLEPLRIKALVQRYSDHIAFPVSLVVAGGDSGEERINRATALWARPRAEIEDDEYKEFYKHIAHDVTDPLAWSHNRVEGKREYTSLLYIPSVAPFDLQREAPKGIKVYVQRVFVTDDATQFLPLYLRFVRGVLDASELALNVSRELLQEDPDIVAIRASLTKRVLDMLDALARDEPEKYRAFWSQFGTVFKEGLAEDPQNRERVASLSRFSTTRVADDAAPRSLEEYLEAAQPEQSEIYYLTAESLKAANSSPHLEVFRSRDVEVLLLVDRIDEWLVQQLGEFRGKKFRDITRGSLPFGKTDGENKLQTELSKDDNHLLKQLKRVLRERVDEVRASERLTESPACLVLGEHDIGHQMMGLLRSAGHAVPQGVPSLEVNLSHPLVKRLARESDDGRFEQLALLVLEQATLAEGRPLEDPGAFVKRLNGLLLELDEPGSTG